MYELIRPLLFKLDAERSHDIAIKVLGLASHSKTLCGLINTCCKANSLSAPVSVMGLNFPNRIGLAAGLDKHAQCIDALCAMGFGHIETGTVTPLPQAGNQKPRLFRLPEHKAIINRMGFNSVGLDQFIDNFNAHKADAIVGINLGKNATTPLENAVNDYILGMQQTYLLADYLTINLSSPNTKDLRELQRGDIFDQLIKTLKTEQKKLADKYGKYTPIAIKIAPDLDNDGIEAIAATCLKNNADAIIATNTTIQREMLGNHPFSQETGGLSGEPLRTASTRVIRSLTRVLDNEIPIIGVGGISSAEDANEKLQAGASLIQCYTGFIYKGPKLVKEINTLSAE